ncbi:unnamed protein product [Brachionus calyciflorus]|uniref:Uncharacterized protein n=1 Tax=Brachionus calyciflorus TaxID=104777 RepID=A0A813PB57_9BILA|nr:unnamed protein product [Brachionus calyciflorus]
MAILTILIIFCFLNITNQTDMSYDTEYGEYDDNANFEEEYESFLLNKLIESLAKNGKTNSMLQLKTYPDKILLKDGQPYIIWRDQNKNHHFIG